MEHFALFLMVKKVAMTSPAQLNARSAHGALGAPAQSLATGVVVQDKAGREELLSLNPKMEECLAQFLMAQKVATTSTAQNTVRWEVGVHGAPARNHANPVKANGKGLSPVDLVLVEYIARFSMERGAAMTFHVQFTAKSAIGALGAPAQSHATLVEVNGRGVSPKTLSAEDWLVQFLKPIKPATTSLADVLMARLVMGNAALKTQTGMDFLTDSQMDRAIFLGRTIVFPYQILGKRTQTVMA